MPDNKQQNLKAMAEELWQSRPQHNIYLLLNPHRPVAESHPLHPNNLWVTEPEHRAIVKRPDFDWLPDVCPLLIHVAGPGLRWPFDEMDVVYEQAIEEAGHVNGAYVCGWIASTASITKIASQLAHSLQTPAGILPLFEPLRLERLAATVEAEWLDQWLNNIDAWVLVSADGRPLLLTRGVTDPSNTLRQWTDLSVTAQARITKLLRCLTAWKELQAALPEEASTKADQQLLIAEQLGLSSLEDQIYLALLALTIKHDWHQHPESRKAILHAQRQPGALSDFIEKLPVSTLQAMGLNPQDSVTETQGNH